MVRKAQLLRRRRADTGTEYDLVLYISGATQQSRSALAAIRDFGETHLKGRYRLAVVDLYQQPDQARERQIIAVPTLVKQAPSPVRHIVGDLSDKQRLLAGLGLSATPDDRSGA